MARNLKYGISGQTLRGLKKGDFQAVRVCDIILETTDNDANRHGGVDALGTIFFSDISIDKGFEFPRRLPTAKPLFSYQKYVPIINEIVLLVQITTNNSNKQKITTNYYLPTINLYNNNNHNAMPISEYGENIVGSENFEENPNLKPLKLFEGDNILEGRYGNSIRLSNQDNNPITIIRNGQYVNPEDTTFEPNVEDLNNDNSSIYLSSKQLNFELICKNKSSYLAEERQYIFADQRLGNVTTTPGNVSQAIIS
tara:strand:+ start:317 stop:1078 length:762 start_codon:yes stop_codon:yes gene_type:complete